MASNVIAKYLIQIGFDEAKVKAAFSQIDKQFERINKKQHSQQSTLNKAVADQARMQQAVSRAKMAELKVEQQNLRVQQQRLRLERTRVSGRGQATTFADRKANLSTRLGYLSSTGRLGASAAGDLGRSLGNARTLADLRSISMQISTAAMNQRALNSQFRLGTHLANRLAASTKQMVGNYVSAFAIGGAAVSTTRTGMEFEAMRASMSAATNGDTAAAANEMKYLDWNATRLGLSLKDTTDAYIKFRFAARDSMTTDQMRGLFTGVSEFGRTMNVDPYRMNLALTAIQQMASKGVVSMEELRRQLNESLPGSMQAFQKAFEEVYGLPKEQMQDFIAQGKMMFKDIGPVLGKYFSEAAAPGLEMAMKKAAAEQQRFLTQVQKAQAGFFDAGWGPAYAEILRQLTELFIELQPTIEALAKTFVVLAKVVGVLIKAISTLFYLGNKYLGGFGTLGLTVFGALMGRKGILGLLSKIPLIGKAFMALKTLGIRSMLLGAITNPITQAVLALTALIAVLDELSNAFESDPTKKRWGFLSNPAGTGRLDTGGGLERLQMMQNNPWEYFFKHMTGPGAIYSLASKGFSGEGGKTEVTIHTLNADLPNVKDSKSFVDNLVSSLGSAMIVGGIH